MTVPEEKVINEIEILADRMISTDDRATKLRLMREADTIFYDVYGVSEKQRSIIGNTVPPWGTDGD